MVYKFKEGVRIPIAPQVAGERLEYIARERGRLRPEDVLEDARPKDSPLHTAFEWNDTVAAEKYRLDQAGRLIRAVVVVYDETPKEEKTVRAFVVAKQNNDEQQAYVGIGDAMSNAKLRDQVIARAKRELQAWVRRYEVFQEFADIIGNINQQLLDDARIPEAAD